MDGLDRRAAPTLRRLRAVNRTGLAAVHGLFFPGIDALAAPIFDASGRIAAVVTVLGPTTSFDASIEGEVAQQISVTAAAISTRIGYAGSWPAVSAARTRSKSSAAKAYPAGAKPRSAPE